MIWKKAKGLFGSRDNAIRMVNNKFRRDVINIGYSKMMYDILFFSKKRIAKYHKNTMIIVSNYIKREVVKLIAKGCR